MKNLKIYCLSLSSSHLDLIENIGYTPVGLGEETFSDKWLSDKSGDNISKKILIMVNIHFTIGYGRIIKLIFLDGLGFVNIVNFG